MKQLIHANANTPTISLFFFARQQCAGFTPLPVFICPSLCLGVSALTEVKLEKEQV